MCNHKTTLEEINNDVRNVIAYMSQRILTPEGVLTGYKIKCMPRLLYKLKHSNLTENQLVTVQQKINGLLKQKMHIPHRTSNDLLYGHRSGGGLEFPHLWAETNIHKLTMLQGGLLKKHTDLRKVLLGALKRLHEWTGLTGGDMQGHMIKWLDLDDTAWISSLWVWMNKHGYNVKIPDSVVPSTGTTIMSEYVQYEMATLTPEDREIWLAYCASSKYGEPFPTELIAMKHRINELAANLRKWKLMYAKDMGDESVTTIREKDAGTLRIKHELN